MVRQSHRRIDPGLHEPVQPYWRRTHPAELDHQRHQKLDLEGQAKHHLPVEATEHWWVCIPILLD